MIYTVEMDEPSDNAVCRCDSCDWTGHYDKVAEIDGCSLTPGDPSPTGRCPECDALVYVQRLNVATIESATAWARIELTDEQISQLARGMGRLVVEPIDKPVEALSDAPVKTPLTVDEAMARYGISEEEWDSLSAKVARALCGQSGGNY